MVKTETPLVSLLIPIYNVEKYLRQCLESAKSQTLSNIEIICINDGSTDSSLDIIKFFMAQDSRFRLIDKANSGYGSSMNQGLDAARGIYVGILESDDFLDDDALETMYKAANEYDADVVKTDFYFYWSEPDERDELAGVITKKMAGIVNPSEQSAIFYLKPSIWSALYRRDFLARNDIRFLETPGASYQDAGFNFKVWASAEKVVFLDRAFLHYRQDNEASSVNSPSKVYCVCDEYAEMQRYLDERPEKKNRLQGILVRMKYDSYMWNYKRLNEQFRLEFLEKAASDLKSDVDKGRLDPLFFEPWADANLHALIASPETFHQHQAKYAKEGKINTLRQYYALGGWSLIRKMTKDKILRGGK